MNPSVTERDPTARAPSVDRTVIPRLEIGLAALLSLAWIIFRIRFFLHAGALWRDEVNSVDLSTSPQISDIWHNLQYDSFPMLWHLLLRYWIRSGIGASDRGIRLLGLLAGLGILAAILTNARRFQTKPIIALTFLGFSTAVICDGGSVRGYGLGMMLELLAFGLIWDVATRPTTLRVISALVVSLAAVHILFYNSVILAAICCGACAVCAFHRQLKRAGLVLGIGFICAGSMTIYASAIQRADSFRPMLLRQPSVTWFLTKFAEAVSYEPANATTKSALNLFTWEITVLIAIFIGAAAIFSKRRLAGDPFRKDVVIYHWTVLAAGLVGYFWFLWRLSYVMQPWYYLALMALLAVCSDGLIGSVRRPFPRLLICLAAFAFACVSARPIWADAGLRKTAIDTDSAELRRLSKKGDLVLVSPWYYGVTFQRYFHGPADYVTVPPIQFLSYHNYDLLIPSMQNTHAMDATIARIAAVLKSGHVVFLFGEFSIPSTDLAYPTISRPAPHNPFGWIDANYYDVWQRQITYFLARHSAQTVPIYVDFGGVSNFERPWLFATRGWIDAQPLGAAATRPDAAK